MQSGCSAIEGIAWRNGLETSAGASRGRGSGREPRTGRSGSKEQGKVAHGADDEGLERPRSETPMKVGVAVREGKPEGGSAQEGMERTGI